MIIWQKIVRLWKLARAVRTLSTRRHLGLISAGVAFWGMFSLFPALAALIAIFGMVADPAVVQEQLVLMQEIIPEDVYRLLFGQVSGLLGAPINRLGWATVVSLGAGLWAARAGTAALVQGLNALHRRPNRGGLWHAAMSLFLTLCLVAMAVAALLTVVVTPVVLAYLPLPALTSLPLEILRWIIAFLTLLAGVGMLYRWGPNIDGPRVAWVNAGSLMFVFFWLAASAGFSVYLSNFGSYNEVYGSIGAVIAMLMWLYLSAYLVLTGAALNVVLAQRAAQGEIAQRRV